LEISSLAEITAGPASHLNNR